MQEANEKIGIMGGTFNPLHYGHLLAAESAREQFGLTKVLFIPSGNPPHKEKIELAAAEDRFNMVSAAICNNTAFEAVRIEISRKGRTYSVDTLTELKSFYGDAVSFYFIIGADNINELASWKDCERLFSLCEFIAVTRPGFDMADHSSCINQYIADGLLKIHIMKTPMLEISSSDIRERLHAGRSIKYMTPECIEEYIDRNRLYIKHE